MVCYLRIVAFIYMDGVFILGYQQAKAL